MLSFGLKINIQHTILEFYFKRFTFVLLQGKMQLGEMLHSCGVGIPVIENAVLLRKNSHEGQKTANFPTLHERRIIFCA